MGDVSLQDSNQLRQQPKGNSERPKPKNPPKQPSDRQSVVRKSEKKSSLIRGDDDARPEGIVRLADETYDKSLPDAKLERRTPKKSLDRPKPSQQTKGRPSSIRSFEQKYDLISDDDDVRFEEIVRMPDDPGPDPSDDLPMAQRRSKRIKVKPLRYWMGEKIVYATDGDGSRSFEFVQPVATPVRKK
jgi:hypothetical protein